MPDPTIGGAPDGAPAFSPSAPQPTAATEIAHDPAPAVPESEAGTGGDQSAATTIKGQAQQQLTGVLDAQKAAAADKVEEFARTVQRSAEQFQGRQDWIASAIGHGAEELNTLAGSLRDKNVGDLIGQVQLFAQRQPALFAGAAFAAGFAVARVGKLAAGGLSPDDLPTMPEVGHGQR